MAARSLASFPADFCSSSLSTIWCERQNRSVSVHELPPGGCWKERETATKAVEGVYTIGIDDAVSFSVPRSFLT